MKYFALGLTCLFCTLAWGPSPASAQIEVFTYKNNKYGLGLHYKVNWFQAQQICASAGFQLASLSSQSAQKLLITFVKTYPQLASLGNELLWTSGTNQGDYNQYVWQSTGSPLFYRNFWASWVPQGYLCIGLNGVTGYWSATNCRDVHYYICESKC